MILIINICLFIFLIIIITIHLLLRKEIKSVENQLKYIKERETNLTILSSTGNKEINRLILEINDILKLKQQTDIQHKKMELEIKHSISNISHDLRTPLTSIMGYLQLMEEPNVSQLEKDEYMSIIKERTKSLQMLITSFYELSRLEGKEYKFNLQPINLSNLLCELIASFYNDFVNKGVEPYIDIDDNAPNIIGDENGVRRVLLNLIQNILKHGEEFVSISLKYRDDTITTIFTNGAKDLSEEDSKLIFKRFFTKDRTRNGNNTGIGLAVTKELVEQMGHKIFSDFNNGRLSIIIIWKIKKTITI